MRLTESTDRPITVTEGTNRVIGHDPRRIVDEVRGVLRDGVEPRRPALWDGHAGGRIAEVLETGAAEHGTNRPTGLRP